MAFVELHIPEFIMKDHLFFSFVFLFYVYSYSLSVSASISDAIKHAYPSEVYWGDTHVHTNLSFDAYGMGNTSLSPEDAYRFAKGLQVTAPNGQLLRLARPLDFIVIADHGGNMGVMSALKSSNPKLLATKEGRYWKNEQLKNYVDVDGVIKSQNKASFEDARDSIFQGGEGGYFWDMLRKFVVTDVSFREGVWKKVTKIADKHNSPGVFTTFSGYEWTASYDAAIHRVVVFKDGSGMVSQVLPFTTYESTRPEDLWNYMADYSKLTQGDVLAIPHNSNISNGTTFAVQDSYARPIDSKYAAMRSQWEPLVEVTQMKGDSETHPFLSPKDSFADYETWNSWQGWSSDRVDRSEWKRQKKYEYARSALLGGLAQEEKVGINPFKFGMIGSTDSHTSLATADEDNFWGKHTFSMPSPFRLTLFNDEAFLSKSWEYAAAGYTAIWAEENTRESLFAAMKRKEVYATTGPRIRVRFFGGWDFQEHDADRSGLAHLGYRKGVPMGGDLVRGKANQSPSFLIRVVKDPEGANLDRVQVIKGWQDASGELQEKIYNVALSDGRKDLGPNTRPVGNTVDVGDASYTNTIGDPELSVVWEDPDFDANERAFYYLRVLEIPTPRWTAYDAKYFQLKDLPEEIPMITQERAYSSPIWYSP